MTSKRTKLVDQVIDELLKERMEGTKKAQEVKIDTRKLQKEKEDKGWARIIIGEKSPEPIVETKPKPVPVTEPIKEEPTVSEKEKALMKQIEELKKLTEQPL